MPLTVSTVFPEQTVETVQEGNVPPATAIYRGVNEICSLDNKPCDTEKAGHCPPFSNHQL
jgi:hypothetical protein